VPRSHLALMGITIAREQNQVVPMLHMWSGGVV
jgi:aspartate oxidase